MEDIPNLQTNSRKHSYTLFDLFVLCKIISWTFFVCYLNNNYVIVSKATLITKITLFMLACTCYITFRTITMFSDINYNPYIEHILFVAFIFSNPTFIIDTILSGVSVVITRNNFWYLLLSFLGIFTNIMVFIGKINVQIWIASRKIKCEFINNFEIIKHIKHFRNKSKIFNLNIEIHSDRYSFYALGWFKHIVNTYRILKPKDIEELREMYKYAYHDVIFIEYLIFIGVIAISLIVSTLIFYFYNKKYKLRKKYKNIFDIKNLSDIKTVVYKVYNLCYICGIVLEIIATVGMGVLGSYLRSNEITHREDIY